MSLFRSRGLHWGVRSPVVAGDEAEEVPVRIPRGGGLLFGYYLSRRVMYECETAQLQDAADRGICSSLCWALGSRYYSSCGCVWIKSVAGSRCAPLPMRGAWPVPGLEREGRNGRKRTRHGVAHEDW